MPYVPPKYPGAIPTAEDLPDRTDDVDWLYAARYNELKKELRAALTELGTDPAGSFATIKARLDDMLPHFHDRGDPGAYDRTVGDFTTDKTWRDLDLSGIVPAGAKAILLRVRLSDDVVGTYIRFRKKGNTNVFNRSEIITQVAGIILMQEVVVACDTNRVIQYYGRNVVFTILSVVVGGWWK